MGKSDVVVVGAGLAGLACALRLQEAGREVLLLEADNEPGGRVRTDLIDGYRIDRGFQVLLTAYPEAIRHFDYKALDLRAFLPGARVATREGWQRIGDPFRNPADLVPTLRAQVGSPLDKVRILRWRAAALAAGEQVMQRPDRTTESQLLEGEGFSTAMVERFFRPFLGGVFLDPSLQTSRRMADFVWQMFARGDIALPRDGMGALPAQLARRLSPGSLQTGRRVATVSTGEVTTTDGERFTAEAVVVATDLRQASALLSGQVPDRGSNGAHYFAFDLSEPPHREPLLYLNGEGDGPINNLHLVTNLIPEAAPPGRALLSVTCLVERPPLGEVRAQLRRWFGAQADGWRLISERAIPDALPRQAVGDLEPYERPVRIAPGLLVCGDHRDQASIQGALRSGRRAAEAILAR